MPRDPGGRESNAVRVSGRGSCCLLLRLTQIREEIGTLRDGIVGEDEIRAALAQFDDLWAALTPKEQVRVLELLIERVVYDGEAGTVAVTFRPSGIRTLEVHSETAT